MAGDDDSPIQPGTSFGDLEVLERIDRGAFAEVFRAHDTLIDRPVALKVLDSSRWADNETVRDKCLNEARIMARVLDPHVVTLYRVRELPGKRWAFEMEYLNGGSLRDRLRREGPLDPAEARRILEAVLRGLEAAHQRGIIHHDIKPGNVLLSKDGAVKLADFGLGRYVAEDDLARGPRGTLPYMAPEVIMGLGAQKASDLWSVGVLLYRMLAGRVPFPARTTEALFLAIQNATPAPLPEGVPPLLTSIALRCLTKDPAERPASAAALLEELARHGRLYGAAAVDPAIAAGPSTLLAGRARELGLWRDHLTQAQEGRGRAVLVLGEAGIGKSALMQEVGREARIGGFRWVEARLTPLEGLRRPLALALHDTLAASDDLSALSTDPAGASADSSRGVEILRRLLDEESSSPVELPLQSTWEIEQALVALAGTKPLALLLEDVQLCDRDELKMLAALASKLTSAPVCLAMTYRTSDPFASDSTDGPPSGYYDLAAAPDVHRLEVEPLGDRAIRTLLEQAAGLPALPLQLVERVIRDSDGVPLYALELYRHLEASGEIERSQDSVRITARWGQAELPRPLRDMVQRRLAGIGDEERALLETAAVAGVEFDGARLAEVMDLPLLGVLRTLQRLYRERALVQPLKQGYRFGHALYQEAIYKDTAPDLRRALHRAWAEVLEPGSTGAAVDPEALGWHWEQAGDPARAAPHLNLAAAAAARRGEYARAWRLAERAGVLHEDATPEELRRNFDLLSALASTFSTEEDARRIERLYARLHLAAEALGDAYMRRRVVVVDSWHRGQRRSGPPIDLEALEDAAAHLPVQESKANAWWLIGRTRAIDGDIAGARRALEQANDLFREVGGAATAVQGALHTLTLLLLHECDFDAAEKTFNRLAEVQLSQHDGSVQGWISRASAIQAASQAGRIEGAGDALDEPIRNIERSGQYARAAQVMTKQAQLYEAEGRIADAQASLQRAEPILRQGVLGATLWSMLRAKARQQIAAGELEAAARTLRDAEAAEGNLPPADLAALEEGWAFLATVRGEHDDASGRLVAALERLAPTPHLLDLSRLLVELVHLAVLGLDLTAALPAIRALAAREAPHPTPIDLALCASSTALRDDLGELDAAALEQAAAATRDPRLGWHQATMGAAACLLSARACLLSGERDAAGALLLEARQRARHLEHVWLELRALQLARDADLDVDPFRVRAAVEALKARNPADPGRTAAVIARWTSGMPRA